MNADELARLQAHLAAVGAITCTVCGHQRWRASGPWTAQPAPPLGRVGMPIRTSLPGLQPNQPVGAQFVYLTCRRCWNTLSFAWRPILRGEVDDR